RLSKLDGVLFNYADQVVNFFLPREKYLKTFAGMKE
ncbi:unnamed protein product, partial [marine sediment metagenome]